VSTIIVTSAQVAAAKLMVRRAYKRGEYPSVAVIAIAEAVLTGAAKEVSKPPVLKCECPFDGDEHKDEYTTHCGCDKCDYPNGTPIKRPKEVSVNMIRTTHTRELDINRITTVGDLFALIDMPYRITKKATVKVEAGTATLRIEWASED